MNVVFAIPGDPATRTGGYGYDRRLAAELRAAGHGVEALRLGDGFPAPSAADLAHARAALTGVPADRVLLVDGLAYGALPASIIAEVRAPTVALVHHPLALETGVDPAAAPAIAAAERAALAFAAGVVVTSPHTAAIVSADYGVERGRLTVAVPGLDPQWRQERTPSAPPLVVSVGSLVPRKGHDILIAALARIVDLGWRAIIVGSPDFAPGTAAALHRQAASLGERLTFAGGIDEAAIRALYREASVFALATRYEGYGMAFVEAMASGLPIVATRGGPVADVVPPDAGLLAAVDDVDGVADALRSVLTDAALAARLSDGARRTAAAAPGWDATAEAVAARLAAAAAS